jgi:uncharacterized protein HemX
METQTDNTPVEDEEVLTTASIKPLALWVTTVLALIVAVAALVLGLLSPKPEKNEQPDWQLKIDELSTELAAVRQSIPIITDYTPQLQAVQREINALSDRQHAENNSNRAALEAMQAKLTRLNTIEERLREGRQNPSLQQARPIIADAIRALEAWHKPDVAVVLLTEAQQVLYDAGDSQNNAAIATLKQAIASLKAMPSPDYQQINTNIEALIAATAELELPGDIMKNQRQSLAEEHTPAGVGASMWNDVKSLISVRRTDKKFTAFASAEGRALSRMVVQLKLEQIRVAALKANQVLFDSLIGATREYVSAQFVRDTEQTPLFLLRLDELAKTRVVLVPDHEILPRLQALLP